MAYYQGCMSSLCDYSMGIIFSGSHLKNELNFIYALFSSFNLAPRFLFYSLNFSIFVSVFVVCLLFLFWNFINGSRDVLFVSIILSFTASQH